MTKGELMRALEPFTDEIEILIDDGDRSFEVDHWRYGLIQGTGVLVMRRGAQVMWRLSPKKAP